MSAGLDMAWSRSPLVQRVVAAARNRGTLDVLRRRNPALVDAALAEQDRRIAAMPDGPQRARACAFVRLAEPPTPPPALTVEIEVTTDAASLAPPISDAASARIDWRAMIESERDALVRSAPTEGLRGWLSDRGIAPHDFYRHRSAMAQRAKD